MITLKAAIKRVLLPLLALLSIQPVHAHCPLCGAAIGVGAVTASYYGVDPSIIGIFVGAFALSMGLWVANKLKKQYVPHQKTIIVILSLVLTIVPVLPYVTDAFYVPMDIFGAIRVLWLNKILAGSIIGVIVFAFASYVNDKIKKIRGRVLFPYQRIALPVSFLVLASVILNYLL